jgi:hypothetical protein
MARVMDYGFAAVSTNTGRNSTMTDFSSNWALNAPEKPTD